MDYLTCIQSFQTVIQEGSFAKAAIKLHTTQSTISKRISWLESRFQTKLITRTTRELNLTDSGKLFLQHSQELTAVWQEIQMQLRAQSIEPAGYLNIAASSTSGAFFVLPMMDSFLNEYPKIKINYAVHNHCFDLIQDQIDIYITTLFMPVSKLTVREALASLNSQIIAAPEYLECCGTPQTLADLMHHNCLIYTFEEEPYRWYFANGTSAEVDGNFQTNTFQSIIAMALQGLGLAFIPTIFVRNELKQKRLKIVLPDYQAAQYQLYAYYQRGIRKQSAARAYLNFIKNFSAS